MKIKTEFSLHLSGIRSYFQLRILCLKEQTCTIFLYNKQNKCTYFSNLFWKESLHVSDNSSFHHQEFFTVHTAMIYVIQIADSLQAESGYSILIPLASCQRTCNIILLCVQWKTPGDGQMNSPNHVELPSKINFRN